jgi:hypothetical protein
MKKSLVLAAVIFSGALAGNAQLVTYDFDAGNATPSVVDGDLTAGNFAISAGNVTFPQGNPTSGSGISGIGWNGLAYNKSWSFVVTANPGISFDLFELTFDHRRSGTGPVSWEVSINGTPTGSGSLATADTWFSESLELSGFNTLESATVTLTAYGASGSTGTWRLDNVVLDGMTLTVVPEPSTWALLGGGLAFLAYRMRRRK